MKVFPRKEKDWNLFFKSDKGEKWFENLFSNGWSVEIIYLVKIFWKVNNLGNYLEFGDVEHAYW